MLKKNVSPYVPRKSDQTIHNICLKLNSKLGGVNNVISKDCLPALMKRPVMLLGADVTHPSPDRIGEVPSIAAIVGSYNPSATKYHWEVSVQYGEKKEAKIKVLEVIEDTERMVRSLLMKVHLVSCGVYSGLRYVP